MYDVSSFFFHVAPHHRAQFDECPIQMLDNYARGTFQFINPDAIYLQFFASTHSAETRIVGTSLDIITWDVAEYEQRLAWFNQTYRCANRPSVYNRAELAKHNLPASAETTSALGLFTAYKNKFGRDMDALDMFDRLLRLVRRHA